MSESVVRALVETSMDALYAVAPEGKVVYWSWGAVNLYGWEASDAVGRYLHELVVPPERWLETRASLQEALSTGSAIGETRRLKRDGGELDVQSTMRSFGEGPDRFVAVSERDITDGKRLEQEAFEKVWSLTDVQNFLQSILEGSEDYSIIATDLEGRIQAWNQGARIDFGHLSTEAMGRHGPALLHAPEDFATGVVLEAFKTALANGRFEGEFVCRRKDGSRFPAKMTINLRKNAYDKPLGYVLIVRDLSDEKAVEAERRAALEQAIELARLKQEADFKTRFINTAAHELGTPLTPIKMQLHLLRNADVETLTDRQRRALRILDRNVDRLAGLLRDVLDVARLQSAQLPVRPAPLDVNDAVRECVESHEADAVARGIELRMLAGEACTLQADRARITQVLDNLIGNALKFTPSGGRVEVETAVLDGRALVRVRDTGIGLSPQQMGKLFLPFSQAHDAMARTDAGAGLGLYVAKGIAEAHGGALTCESAGEGKGSCFTLELPRG